MKWFSVAREGQTTDGRAITREWIEQMAAGYDRANYQARIWMEHFRSVAEDGMFPALGDVLALSTEERGGKLCLLAQLEPTERLRRINAAKQKLFSSIEVDPDFAGTGKAYLVGLGVTDSPASLGTEALNFSAISGLASPLTARKVRPENLFTVAIDAGFDFADTPATGDTPNIVDRVRELLAKARGGSAVELQAMRADVLAAVELMSTHFAEDEAARVADRAAVEQASSALATIDQRIATLENSFAQFAATPDRPPFAPALGGNGGIALADY